MNRPGTRNLALLVLALSLGALALAPGTAPGTAAGWSPYHRPATYGVVTQRDVPITMRDGVVLRADVARPDAAGRSPVLVVQTPYNKDGGINAFLGGTTSFFVRHGYVVVTVDVRGTGSSEGVWTSFGPREQRDGPQVVEWAARQRWSSGKVGLFGPSYMGLNQLLTAARRPPHLKAIFPIVPMADAYRDIVFSGGDINVSFIPLWLGLVAAGGLTPPTYALSSSPDDLLQNLLASVTTLASHLSGVVSFDAASVVDASTGGDLAYDGPYWKTRSPLEQVDRIDVPAFVVGGEHDLFQRGEPLIYERLKQRVQAHLLVGPWTHIEGSTGAGLPKSGVPSLNQIALRWFDHWLRGDPTHPGRMPAVTQYVLGGGRYETQPDWPNPRLTPRRLYLRGGGRLSPARPGPGEAPKTFLQQPFSGICTQSTSQWTAGATEQLPCTADNRLNELGEAVYTTPPLRRPLQLDGPAVANIWLTTTTRDAPITVRVTDVSPSGRSTELTSGWLAGSFREVLRSHSRYVDGQLVQPWHPFTRRSVHLLKPGQPTRLPVEIFPTRAVIPKGDRLRITVGPSDFPHQAPPLPQLVNELGGAVRILTTPRHPSYVTLPGLGDCGACPPLPVPDLTR